MVQTLGLLPPTRETQLQLQALDLGWPAQAVTGIWGGNQKMEDPLSLFSSLSLLTPTSS